MICPRCASNQSDDIKFCTFCGANLQAVREALEVRESDKKPDWDNNWLSEMFKTGQLAEIRKLEMQRRLGLTPEVKRYNEIKAGVIASSVGIALAIFLFVFMQGIAGNVPPDAARVITRLWIAGIIPFMVGLALILNGVLVSKKIVEALKRDQKGTNTVDEGATPRELRAANTSEFIPANMSVTDQTTRHLENSERKINR